MTSDELEIEVRLRMNRMRGRMAGLIESFGLPERQERACVTTLKSLTYDIEADLVDLIKQ